MAGQRQAKDTPIVFAPGIVSNLTDRDATNRYKASNRVRWHKGLPEKLGGWVRQTLTGANSGVYIGVARALHDWSSLDTAQWIAIGTHCKLYLINNGRLSDITPMRKASNLTAALSVTIGSPTITVTDPDHRARRGDHLTITATAPIGGFDVSGVYDIDDIPTPDTFTVTFGSNFNSTEVGGGSLTIEYDIGCGLAENGELRGYGTDLYGMHEYGTPRPVGSGVPARMRTWSLDNWGEDLLASPSDGELYWWDRTLGPNSRAALVTEAPGAIQRMLVNGSIGHVILLGCTNIDGTPDPMRIRWCAQENFRQWDPQLYQTAGGKRLDKGSRLITGIVSRSTNYVWSDTMMYSLAYVGRPDIYVPVELGTVKIVGPNAAADDNGTAYFMAFDDFMIFDGTLRVLICEMHTFVFGDENRNIEGKFDRTQAEAVYCSTYQPKNEVTWWYPGTDGLIYYITYNTVLQCWYGGLMERTAYHDVSEAITGYKTNPYGVNGGYLYKHEVGTDEVEGATTTPQAWYLESYDINAGGSDAVFLINNVIPNFDRLSGGMRLLLKKKSKPRQRVYQTRGPYTITEDTVDLGVRCKASQVALRFESRGLVGEDWRMGVFQWNPAAYGGRVGVEAYVPTGTPELSGSSLATTVNLSWTVVSGSFAISEFRLYRSVDSAPYALLATIAGNTLAYQDNFLSGVTHSYYVVAVADDGVVSPNSNVIELERGNVVLLQHFDGSLVDSSGYSNVTTLFGSAAVVGSPTKFGAGALSVSSIGAYATLPISAGSALDIFQGDFTVELWAQADNVTLQRVICDFGDFFGSDGFRVYFISGQVFCQASFYNGWSDITNVTPVTANTWVHIAVCRAGNQGYLAVNGIVAAAATANWNNFPTTATALYLGASSNSGIQSTWLRGLIDEVRVTKGVALYTSNFTPPNSPFSPP